MDPRLFRSQIDFARDRLELLQHREHEEPTHGEVIQQAFEELRTTIEELSVADEEIRQQNEELGLAFQQLDFERDRYRELFESAPYAYVVTNAHASITQINRAAESLFDVQRRFVIGKSLVVFVHADHRRAFRERLARCTSACTFDSHFESRTGREFPAAVTILPVPLPNGGVQLRWTFRDTTAQVQQESEILAINLDLESRISARTEELLDTIRLKERILEEERVARASADALRGRIEYLAESSSLLAEPIELTETLVRFAEHAVQGIAEVCLVDLVQAGVRAPFSASAIAPTSPLTDVPRLRSLGVLEALKQKVLNAPAPALIENDAFGADPIAGAPPLGSLLCVAVQHGGATLGTVTLIRSRGSEPFGPEDAKTMEILSRRVAMAVENARLKREQEEFLAMLGHELRNPVSAIRHSAAVLQSQLPDSQRNLSAIVMRQSKHLTRLVDDLVDLTRVRHGKMILKKEVVDLEAAVRSCVETLEQSGRSDTWRIRIHAEPVRIEGDPMRLRQIVENLLDNALKYSPPGSPVELDVQARGGDAVLTVRDHGKGIPVELAGKIFDPFVQLRGAEDALTGGLGLGLALVQRLVRLHDGRIEVHSAGRDAGSEFILRFPAVAQRGSEGNGAANDSVTPALRILLVEDNRDSREALRLLLQLWGHTVEEADDGPTALARCATFHPDLVFVDIGLPGMDGYEVARTLRGVAQPPRSIVALTGFGRPGDRRRALEAGFDEHLLKPPAGEELGAVLSKAASQAGAD